MTTRTRLTIALLFVVLQLLDVLTTYFGLRAGAPEANPLMGGLMAQAGEGVMYGVKVVGAGLVLLAITQLKRRYAKMEARYNASWVALRALNCLVLAVVVNNLVVTLI